MSGSKVQLREVLEKYLAASGGCGYEIAIFALGFSREGAEDVFSAATPSAPASAARCASTNSQIPKIHSGASQ